MKKQCVVNFALAGMSITQFGMKIPSPFCSLTLNNSETDSYTSWELSITTGGDSAQRVNIAAFEALIYQAAQTDGYANASGIPVSFMLGWLNNSNGGVNSYISYQGWSLKYSVKTSGMFMNYILTGYASQILRTNMPVLNISAVSGIVQPSAVVEGLSRAIGATDYYELDIDHCDAPTLVSHGPMTTSYTSYIKGDRNGQDDYGSFPGLLPLSKSYNASRDAAGVANGMKLSTLLNNASEATVEANLVPSLTDKTPQNSSFSFWIDEPTMTKPGIIHYKCTSNIMPTQDSSVLKYGTPDSNILSLSGNYDGVAYNMSNMSFSTVGFTLDNTGTTIVNDATVVNSWSNSLEKVYQTANIINDINALATQFSGDFTVTIPGSVRGYRICEPISLIVMSGNTLSPVSGIYNITGVSHTISNTFITTLKLKRLSISSANQTATSIGITTTNGIRNGTDIRTTANIISTGKVEFGKLYPQWIDIQPLRH